MLVFGRVFRAAAAATGSNPPRRVRNRNRQFVIVGAMAALAARVIADSIFAVVRNDRVDNLHPAAARQRAFHTAYNNWALVHVLDLRNLEFLSFPTQFCFLGIFPELSAAGRDSAGILVALACDLTD